MFVKICKTTHCTYIEYNLYYIERVLTDRSKETWNFQGSFVLYYCKVALGKDYTIFVLKNLKKSLEIYDEFFFIYIWLSLHYMVTNYKSK